MHRIAKHMGRTMFQVVLWSVAAVLPLWTGIATAADPPAESAALPVTAISERWGIEIVGMRLAAGGNMLDFRYKVLDGQKATALLDRNSRPSLLHQASGKVMSVPKSAKVGSLRNTGTPKEGRTYWIFFGNQTKLVQAGDLVTVSIGDFKAENLLVE